MTCITKLLELKGDKEFLPVNDHVVIEGGGNYKGYEYLITFTEFGTRCGYVALKPEEATRFNAERDVENTDYYYPNLRCHWGLTFYGDNHSAKNLLPIPCNDVWVGFDCAHAGDGCDKDLAIKYFNEQCHSDEFYDAMSKLTLSGEIVHRTYQYVEDNCKRIIDQLMEQAA